MRVLAVAIDVRFCVLIWKLTGVPVKKEKLRFNASLLCSSVAAGTFPLFKICFLS